MCACVNAKESFFVLFFGCFCLTNKPSFFLSFFLGVGGMACGCRDKC